MSSTHRDRLASTASERPVRRLPDALVDQIAAGEVVERPASVVKELVENAVDAGARRLRVEIRGGGASLIAVGDDGHGMEPEDAERALERHATSKLRQASDLAGIRSFGFRGEALPAIASVSRFRLRTRPRARERGYEIRVEGGRREPSREVSAPAGTRVEVADLFGQVPARRKFLKTPQTEWGHIHDWLGRAALALPGVHFDVQRDDRPAVAWPAVEDPLERIAAVLSDRDAAALVETSHAQGALHVQVFVSRPEVHRPTASGVHLFVNARPVRDRLLRHALLQVTRDVLPRGRFPVALVFLEVDPERVDVNVHPAKWEVRFDDPQAVHRLVGLTVRQALGRRGEFASTHARGSRGEGRGDDGAQRGVGAPGAAGLAFDSMGLGRPGEAGQAGDWVFAARPEGEQGLVRDAMPGRGAAGEQRGFGQADARPVSFAKLRPLGQLLATYLLLEGPDGLLLVDQHAAHERVLYERLRAGWLEGGAERQALLVPETLELEPGTAEIFESAAETVRALGFEVEAFGGDAVVVRAVPALLADRGPLALLRSLADELRAAEAVGVSSLPDARALEAADRLFASAACHAARRAGEVLAPGEQQALLEALDAIPWAPTCPHGRPVAVPVSRREIERRFGRS